MSLQPQLSISQPGDRYEQEADRMADRIMGMPASGINGLAKVLRQPVEEKDEEERLQAKAVAGHSLGVAPDMAVEMASMQGGGQPLSTDQRAFFEPRFGFSFSKVRIHRGSQATEAARSIGARAYTFGNHIVFGQNEYQPTKPSGQHLLAHELTHVIQQTGNGQAPGAIMSLPVKVQRASLEGCQGTQPDLVNAAMEQAMQDMDTAIPLLEPTSLSQKAQDALWLTFRDTEDITALMVRDVLNQIQDVLPQAFIYCEQVPDYRSDCKKGAVGYCSRGGEPDIHLCMGRWESMDAPRRATTLIHELAHYFISFGGDPGYFGADCEKTSETAALSTAERIVNADSYSCLVYLIAHENEDTLRSRVRYYQREYRGETLERIVQYPPGGIDLNAYSTFNPIIYIKFEGIDQVTIESPIPGAEYRWNIFDAMGTAYPISFDPGQEGQYTSKSSARIQLDTRQQLKARGISEATIQCEIKIPGAEVEKFTLRLLALFSTPNPGQKEIANIPFETGSHDPDDAAMEELAYRLVWYQGILSRETYHIDFEGHASRLGNDDDNQKLSYQRVQAVKDQLESLLVSASEDPSFKLDPDQIAVVGKGEERAREAMKPPDDDSPSDRVVQVTFEVT